VQGGDFALALNFPSSTFLGEERFLEVRTRAGTATGAYTVLTPRQLIRNVPEALRANAASTAPWSGITGVPAGFADGIDNAGVSSITAGAGLSGGTITGTGTIAIANGGIIQAMIATGAVGAAQIASGAVGAAQLAANAVGTAQINDTQVQRRVGGTCAIGEYFRGINADGSTLCEPVPGVPRISAIAAGPTNSATAQPSVAIGTDGLPVVAYVTTATTIRVARCANAACTVVSSDNEVVAAPALNPAIVVRSDGRPMVGYYNLNGSMRVASCANAACSGAATVYTIDSRNTGQSLAMTIGPNGRIWIALHDGGPSRDLYLWGCFDQNCNPASASGAVQPRLIDSAGDVGGFLSIAVGADNRPVIAYRDATNSRLKVAKCGPVVLVPPLNVEDFCSAPVITDVDSIFGRDLGFYPSIAVPADGNPVISHHDGTGGAQLLRFLKCANPACSAITVVRNVDTTVGVGGFSSIAVPADNLPVIAYLDDPLGALKFAKCRTATCGESAIISTLDDNAGAEDTGWEARMVLGRDGLPLVVYQDLLSRQVRAVKCGSRSCQ
jgi:hypothetical protein